MDCIEIEFEQIQFVVVGLVGPQNAVHAEDDLVDQQAEASELVRIEENELAKVPGQFQASMAQNGRGVGSLSRPQADASVEQIEELLVFELVEAQGEEDRVGAGVFESTAAEVTHANLGRPSEVYRTCWQGRCVDTASRGTGTKYALKPSDALRMPWVGARVGLKVQSRAERADCNV